MESNEVHIEYMQIENYTPIEEEKEKACNSYLMSLVAVIVGLPMPIINLLATGFFWFMSRKASFYVRWHCTQALISQVPLFVMNNILFWWTIRILLCWTELSSSYISYFIVVNLYNIYDLIATSRSAILARKGGTHKWFAYGALTDILCRK